MKLKSYLLLWAALMGATLMPSAASAQNARDFMVRLPAVGVLPDVSGTVTPGGGSP